MRSTFALAAIAAVANALPQGGSPTAPAPAGCATTVPGTFQITVVNLTSSAKRDLSRRDTLTLTLKSSVLTDQQGRVGSIVANRQFQFDPAPGQAGAIYTSGFSLCANNSIAIGGSTTFYQCLSGDFYNLYDQSQGGQCTPINIVAIGASGSTGTASVTQKTDGQPIATSATAKVTQISDGQLQAISQISDGQLQMPTGTLLVSQISDGQIQATSAAKVSQISDGQVQATSAAKVSQISDGQVQASSAVKVSQISDGQLQVTSTAKPVSQIGDGQVQAPTSKVSQISDGQIQAPKLTSSSSSTGKPVSQISDGQVQAPKSTASGKPVSQISDGQVQAPTSTGKPVSQISDGQVQAPKTTSSAKPVSQISDGQVQAPTGSKTTTASVVQFTGAASHFGAGNAVAAVAGLAAAVAMF